MTTTALYSNRIVDKAEVEQKYRFPELGSELPMVIAERYASHLPQERRVFSNGYTRIVYGDHGPYVEFSGTQIVTKIVSKFRNNEPDIFYIWMYPPLFPDVKVYWQQKTVARLPNAPARDDGKPHRFNRREGYADYRVGMYYVNPKYFQPF